MAIILRTEHLLPLLVWLSLLPHQTSSVPTPDSRPEPPGLSPRQLGDIEFTNRYADYLKSKAKMNKITSLLNRIQSIKRSDEDDFYPKADVFRSALVQDDPHDPATFFILWCLHSQLNDSGDETLRRMARVVCPAADLRLQPLKTSSPAMEN